MNNNTNISSSSLEIEKINIISYENEDKNDFEILNDMYKKLILKESNSHFYKKKDYKMIEPLTVPKIKLDKLKSKYNNKFNKDNIIGNLFFLNLFMRRKLKV